MRTAGACVLCGVSQYASTRYGEDFTDTFMYIMSANTEYLKYIQEMAFRYPDCQAVKKMAYLRQLLCDTFSIDPAEFPDTNPPAPSAWAKDAIAEYQTVFEPCARSNGFDFDGVVPPEWMIHDKSYQDGATRVRFAYSMYHDLTDRLCFPSRYSTYSGLSWWATPGGLYLSKEEYRDQWYGGDNFGRLKMSLQEAGIPVFTDVASLYGNGGAVSPTIYADANRPRLVE